MARVPHLFGRDPFARTTIKRFLVSRLEGRKTCHNCGSRSGRFRYAVESDGLNTTREDPGYGPAFCDVTCWREYSF